MTYYEKEWIEKFNDLIEANLDNPNFATDDYCRELGLSRSQLFRIVKENAQLSISLYIRKRKLLKAKDLLDISDFKIAEVSYQIGLDSPQSFSKFFTREFGISPTEYRKNRTLSEISIPEPSEENMVEVEIKDIVTDNIPRKTSINRLYLFVGLALIIVVLLAFFVQQKGRDRKNTEGVTSSVYKNNSIAILPFKNMGNPETDFFVEGAVEQIYSSLALIEDLNVISKSSSFLFKDSKKL